MLSVSSPLIAVAMMLFCIVLLEINFRLDGLNSPTTRPIPGGRLELGMGSLSFKLQSIRAAKILNQYTARPNPASFKTVRWPHLRTLEVQPSICCVAVLLAIRLTPRYVCLH